MTQEDRKVLHEYLVALFRQQPESAPVASSFKDALTDAIPALGAWFGRRKAVVAGTTVTNTDAENTKREALFQLRRLLEVSATYADKRPWIPYLAAHRRPRFMECYRISTTSFADFGDKTLVDETSRLADNLGVKAANLMDSETTSNVGELISFQARQERVASAISILEQIIGSPYRALIQKRLNGEPLNLQGNYLAVRTVDNWAEKPMIGCFFIGAILLMAGGMILFDDKNPSTPAGGTLLLIGVALVIAAVWLLQIDRKLRKEQEAEKSKSEANELEKHRIESILYQVNRLADAFETTVKLLLAEMHIPATIGDMERIHAQLKAYEKWGRELESYYTKT